MKLFILTFFMLSLTGLVCAQDNTTPPENDGASSVTIDRVFSTGPYKAGVYTYPREEEEAGPAGPQAQEELQEGNLEVSEEQREEKQQGE